MDLRSAIPERVRRMGGAPGAGGLAALVVLLAPLLVFPRFPSQDGPSHVANSWVLHSLLLGRGGDLAGFYRLNLEPFPNWMTHACLAGLMSLMGPVAAEKTFLIGQLLLLFAAFRYALGSLRNAPSGLVLLVLPLVYDSSLHLGYYNRVFAATPLLLALGFWLRRDGRPGPRATAVLAGLLLWLYFCAAVSLLVALVCLVSLLAAVTLEEAGRRVPDRKRALARRLLALSAATAVPLLLVLRFEARQSRGVAGPGPGALERLRGLATLDWLVALDPRELWLSTALAGVIALALLAAVLLRRRRGGWHRHDALLGAAMLCAAAYLAAPPVRVAGTGPWGGTSHDRIAPHIPLLALLWLAAQPLGPRLRRLLALSALGASLGFLGLRLPRYAELDAQLREYLSVAPWLPERATLLPLGFAHQGRLPDGSVLAARTWPFRHAAGWLVASRGVVDVDNYEAEVSFFPVVLRPGYDPYRLLGSSLDRMPACVRIDRFNRLAPRPAEFLLLWGARWADRSEPCAAALFAEIDAGYRRVYLSSPRGEAELLRRVTR
jgi:hypothetical protein